MTILHSAPAATPTDHHRVRASWLAVAVSPVALVLSIWVGVALAALAETWFDVGAGWGLAGGALLATVALAAPTYAIVEARRAGHEHAHGADAALAGAAVDWLAIVAVLAIGVVSSVAMLVAITLSTCVVLLAWGPPDDVAP